MDEGRAVDSNMNGFSSFSSNLFGILVFYLEVGDVGSGMVVGSTVFVNCTGDMTIVFFYSIFQISDGFSYVRNLADFFWAGPFIDKFCFIADGMLSFWVHKDRFKGVYWL